MENGDSIDAWIGAGVRLLGLPLEPERRPAIRAQLEVALQLGRLVDEFPLPDDVDPAALFRP